MISTISLAAEALYRELRTNFYDAYEQARKTIDPRLGWFMDLGLPSDKAKEIYAYRLANPQPVRVDKGNPIPVQGTAQKVFEVANTRWGIGCQWHYDDMQDDQTGNLAGDARSYGEGFQLIPERVGFQILTGSTDADLLESVPNAPDGAALFATTDGAGSNRFGVANGNLLTGNGVATVADVQSDIYSAINQFSQMLDGEGRQLWPDSIVDQGVGILCGYGNRQVFEKAIGSDLAAEVILNAAGSENVAAAAIDNVLKRFRGAELWATHNITDNDFFVCLKGCKKKPMFQQAREPVMELKGDFAGSDHARHTLVYELLWTDRNGYGVFLPYGIVKVNN